jgi:hypothetical protein
VTTASTCSVSAAMYVPNTDKLSAVHTTGILSMPAMDTDSRVGRFYRSALCIPLRSLLASPVWAYRSL